MRLPKVEKLRPIIATNQTEILKLVLAAVIILFSDKFLLLTTGHGFPLKLMVFGLWFWAIFLFKLGGQASLWVGWGFLVLELIFKILIPEPFLLEQTALFAFYFFLLGIIQLITETLRKERFTRQRKS